MHGDTNCAVDDGEQKRPSLVDVLHVQAKPVAEVCQEVVSENGEEGQELQSVLSKPKMKKAKSIHFEDPQIGVEDEEQPAPSSSFVRSGSGILPPKPARQAPRKSTSGLAMKDKGTGSMRPDSRRTSKSKKPFGGTNSVSSTTSNLAAYVDKLPPEDIGLSFCIRAVAEFGPEGGIKKDTNSRHLHGLDSVFPSISPEAREGHAHIKSVMTIHRAISNVSQVLGCSLRSPHPPVMWLSATSLLAVRTQFFLSMSAMASCMFVIGSVAVEPTCKHGGQSIVVWGHIVNSILYCIIAIPSRCFFTRVDFRHGEEITDCNDVLLSHLSSPGLSLDFISLIGFFAEIYHRTETGNRPGNMPTVAQWIMLFQMLKAWRIILPEDNSDSENGSLGQGILKLLFYLIGFSHVVGCSFLICGNVEAYMWPDWPNWLDDSPSGLDMTHCVVRYTESVYFAIIGLAAVGYTDVLITGVEHGLNSFFLLISQLFAAKVCADLTWLTSMYNKHEAVAHERRRSLILALDKMGVPNVLVGRVLAFQSYENTMHADNMEKDTFQGLGRNLMEELRLCTYRKLVLQAPFLREQPTEVISFIVNALIDEVYLPSDFIVRAGERGRELFFVRRGEARAYLGPHAPTWGQSNEVAIIKAGSYFGELAMLTGLPRGSFVMSTSYCICSILPYSMVENLVELHPEAFTVLVQTMVRMYSLKPDITWKDLSIRMRKKFAITNDYDAFVWFKGHDDHPDVEELYAKAFDSALQKLKVNHLDRRIFWSELDRDASGGISFEEFKGKLYFGSSADGVHPNFHAAGTLGNSDSSADGVHPNLHAPGALGNSDSFISTLADLPPSATNSPTARKSLSSVESPGAMSHVSVKSKSSSACDSSDSSDKASSLPVLGPRKSLTSVDSRGTRSMSGSEGDSSDRASQVTFSWPDLGAAAPEQGAATPDKTLAVLLEQNRRLVQEIHRLHSLGS